MRMSFPLFIGLLIALAGLSIMLDALFKVHLPLVRSALALLLIFFGVRMLVGAWAPQAKDTSTAGSAVMSDLQFAPTTAENQMKYDIIFGRGTIDLTQIPKPERPMTVDINSIFSSTTVTIDPTWPVLIEGSSAFGEVRMPDQSTAAFGAARYQTGASDARGLIRLRVNVVFGSCVVLESGSTQKARPGAVSAVTP